MITEDVLGVAIEWGPGQVPLITLVDDWCARVVKLATDAAGDLESSTAWTAWDLIGAYILRDAIHDGLESCRQPGDNIELPAVAAADRLLRSFCQDDEMGVIKRLAADDYGRAWWWRIVPRTGPVAVEAGYLNP